MQPGFSGGCIVPAVDGFIEHVRAIAAEPGHLLRQPLSGLGHQVLAAALPQLIAMSHGSWHAFACSFEDMLAHRLRIERRQLAMPIDGTAAMHSRSGFRRRGGAHEPILQQIDFFTSIIDRSWPPRRART